MTETNSPLLDICGVSTILRTTAVQHSRNKVEVQQTPEAAIE